MPKMMQAVSHVSNKMCHAREYHLNSFDNNIFYNLPQTDMESVKEIYFHIFSDQWRFAYPLVQILGLKAFKRNRRKL